MHRHADSCLLATSSHRWSSFQQSLHGYYFVEFTGPLPHLLGFAIGILYSVLRKSPLPDNCPCSYCISRSHCSSFYKILILGKRPWTNTYYGSIENNCGSSELILISPHHSSVVNSCSYVLCMIIMGGSRVVHRVPVNPPPPPSFTDLEWQITCYISYL